MPGFSFQCRRFFRFRRSRSKSSSVDACNDAPVASPCLDPSHSLSFRPSSTLNLSQQDMNAAPSASHLSIPGTEIHQSSTRRPPLNRVPVDFGGQPSQASRLVTSIGAVPPSAVSVSSPHHSVVQRDTQLAPPSDHTDSVQAQKPPVSLSLLHMQMTASQRSFNYEPPTVSFSYQFQLRNKMLIYS